MDAGCNTLNHDGDEMPIYEFFCDSCNVIFNFFSRRIDTTTAPSCPRCGKEKLARQMSTFATIGKAADEGGEDRIGGIKRTGDRSGLGFADLERGDHFGHEDPVA
jgi:putative FmdB family regulatory protein